MRDIIQNLVHFSKRRRFSALVSCKINGRLESKENNSMTEAEKDAISSDDLHTGLLVFCTDTNKL